MFLHYIKCGLFCYHLFAAKLPDVHPADEDVVSEGYLTASLFVCCCRVQFQPFTRFYKNPK